MILVSEIENHTKKNVKTINMFYPWCMCVCGSCGSFSVNLMGNFKSINLIYNLIEKSTGTFFVNKKKGKGVVEASQSTRK